MKSWKICAALFLCIAGFSQFSFAACSNLPYGNYLETCVNCVLRSNTLSCWCRTGSHTMPIYSKIRYATECRFVTTHGGRLACRRGFIKPIPDGSYLENCSQCSYDGDDLSCTCESSVGYFKHQVDLEHAGNCQGDIAYTRDGLKCLQQPIPEKYRRVKTHVSENTPATKLIAASAVPDAAKPVSHSSIQVTEATPIVVEPNENKVAITAPVNTAQNSMQTNHSLHSISVSEALPSIFLGTPPVLVSKKPVMSVKPQPMFATAKVNATPVVVTPVKPEAIIVGKTLPSATPLVTAATVAVKPAPVVTAATVPVKPAPVVTAATVPAKPAHVVTSANVAAKPAPAVTATTVPIKPAPITVTSKVATAPTPVQAMQAPVAKSTKPITPIVAAVIPAKPTQMAAPVKKEPVIVVEEAKAITVTLTESEPVVQPSLPKKVKVEPPVELSSNEMKGTNWVTSMLKSAEEEVEQNQKAMTVKSVGKQAIPLTRSLVSDPMKPIANKAVQALPIVKPMANVAQLGVIKPYQPVERIKPQANKNATPWVITEVDNPKLGVIHPYRGKP